MPVTGSTRHRPSPAASAEAGVTLGFDWAATVAKESKGRRLSPAQLLLLLLDAGRVSGRTTLQKQVFLSYREVFGTKAVLDPGFRPDRFGPYSQLIADLPPTLRAGGWIRILARGEGRSTYIIGPRGADDAATIRQDPTVEKRFEVLLQKKASWDEWSTKGILHYVYRNYPEYATRTAIPSMIWE